MSLDKKDEIIGEIEAVSEILELLGAAATSNTRNHPAVSLGYLAERLRACSDKIQNITWLIAPRAAVPADIAGEPVG